MNEVPSAPPVGSRRNEDIALDLMRFIATTTGFGRTGTSSAGFSGAASPNKPEDYATQLIDLYSRCLDVVQGSAPEKK